MSLTIILLVILSKYIPRTQSLIYLKIRKVYLMPFLRWNCSWSFLLCKFQYAIIYHTHESRKIVQWVGYRPCMGPILVQFLASHMVSHVLLVKFLNIEAVVTTEYCQVCPPNKTKQTKKQIKTSHIKYQ